MYVRTYTGTYILSLSLSLSLSLTHTHTQTHTHTHTHTVELAEIIRGRFRDGQEAPGVPQIVYLFCIFLQEAPGVPQIVYFVFFIYFNLFGTKKPRRVAKMCMRCKNKSTGHVLEH